MIKTFRAKSLPDAIAQIRRELGPDASVLHTREVGGGLWGRMTGSRAIEVAASADIVAPSRFSPPEPPPTRPRAASPPPSASSAGETRQVTPFTAPSDTGLQLDEITPRAAVGKPSDALSDVLDELTGAGIDGAIAQQLVDEARRRADPEAVDGVVDTRSLLPAVAAERFTTSGPIATQHGRRRLVALVGPTGVGKTTTIAKIAANFRLQEGLRVGLITVDTYRVAAVEQLRTYADIIDLPMEVVGTPQEMRDAVDRLAGLDLVLLDTAGRSPRDEAQLQELQEVLAEAAPDEVHLVLSATAGAEQLTAAADRFRPVGVTSLLLTKLDEAAALGHLLTLVDESRLPVSYTTHGQNVPDDIAVATPAALAGSVLGHGG